MINLRSRAWHNVVFRIGMPVVLWAAGWPLLAAAAQVPDPLQGAQWIQAPHASAQDAVMPVFRRQFVLEKPLQRATLTIAALGQGEVHVNGVKAGDAELTPSWTDYRKTIRYQQLDVTPLLHPGQNVMGVLVGNGMYNVVRTPHRYTKLENSYGAPRLIALLQLRYTDGTTGRIASDAAWQTTAGPIVFSSTYGGEDYDATREPAGWDKPAAVAPGWQPAQLTDGPGGALHAEVEPPIRVMQRYAAKRLADPRPGVAVYDFGQNFAGWPEITVRGQRGASVKLTPGELLASDGTVSQHSSGGPQWFRYTLRGGASEPWHPRFSYYGFRYLQVEWSGGAGQVLALTGDAVHSSSPRTGAFASSSEALNRIHKLIVEAMHNNSVSLFTDCPHREKLGWLEETHLVAPGLLYNNDLRGLYRATAQNIADAQHADGEVPTIAPQYTVFGPKYAIFDDSPEWGSASVLAAWATYRFYGDLPQLAEAYPVMQHYVEYLKSRAQDGIVAYGLGDWYDIGPGAPGVSKLTSLGVTGTLMLYEDAHVMSRVATLLGKPDDASRYAALAAQEADAFNRRYFHADQAQYDTGSQTANAMPLALGLVPTASRAAVLQHIVDDIHAHHDHVTTGEVGYPYLVRALMQAGRSDVVLALMLRNDPPSYGSQLAAGATSLTEAWDANPDASQDHFMLGGAEEWFYRGLAGLDFDLSRPSGQQIVFRPALLDGVNWARASFRSTLGPVASEWTRHGKVVTVRVTVPAAQSAEVWLTPRDGQRINKPIAAVALPQAAAAQDNAPDGAQGYRVRGGVSVFTLTEK